MNRREGERERERGGTDRQTLPDNVPTPMTRTSQMASSVMTGPCMDIPWAMFLWTSSWVLEFRANRAMAQALDRSISSRKNGSASLKIKEKIKITHCLKWAHQSLCPLRRKLAPYFNFMVLNKVVKYFKNSRVYRNNMQSPYSYEIEDYISLAFVQGNCTMILTLILRDHFQTFWWWQCWTQDWKTLWISQKSL